MMSWLFGGEKPPPEDKEEVSMGMTLDDLDRMQELSAGGVNKRLSRFAWLLDYSEVSETFSSLLFGTVVGQYVVLAIIAVLLLIAGSLSWGLGTDGGNEVYDSSVSSSIWWSYTIFIDTGTQTGFVPGESDIVKFVVVVFSGLGLLFNLAFLSVMIDHVRGLLDRLYRRYAQIFVRDHVVILGWTGKTMFLVEQLIAMFEDNNNGRGEIVIMGHRSAYEMRRAIELNFRRHVPPKPWTVRIRVWEGDVGEEDDLKRLSLHTSRFVLCLGESEDPRVADSQVIETLLSLQSLDPEDKVTGTTIAELRTRDSSHVVHQINQTLPQDEDVLGINSAAAVDKVLALQAIRPALGLAVASLMQFEGDNFFFEEAGAELVGRTFGQLRSRFPLCVLCGVHSSKMAQAASEIVIAPPASRVIRPADRLLLMCRDHWSSRVVREEGGATKVLSITKRLSLRAKQELMMVTSRQRPAEVVRPPILRGPTSKFQHSQPPADPKAHQPQTVLLLGWTTAREMADLVRSLTKVMAPGSEVHILSDVDPAVREQAFSLETNFIGAAISGLASTAADGIAKVTRSVGGVDYLRNFNVTQHAGSPLSAAALDLLDIDSASVAIVLGDGSVASSAEDLQTFSESNGRMRDARVFHISTLLRKHSATLHIVPVYWDILSWRIISRGGVLASVDDARTSVMHRNATETGLIAMQADDPTLVVVFAQLLSGMSSGRHSISSMTVAEAQHTLRLGELHTPLSFSQISNAVYESKGHVVTGFYDPTTGVLVCNSANKDEPRMWQPHEELVFLQAAGAAY